jgi:D-proline reductase (dithiol) PrdB
MIDAEKNYHETLECPTFHTEPWVDGPPLNKRRVAIISTAGLHTRDDKPFIQANELVMSHVSANFDRSGFQQDWNVVFPIDRLRELAQQGIIGSVADYHYSFMGAHDPMSMEQTVHTVATLLKKDNVNAALFLPV